MTFNPRHKLAFARVAALGGLPASMLAGRFDGEEARALIAGLAAHAIAPFSSLATSGVGLMLGVIGHVMGWPLSRGGSSAITGALARRLAELGGSIETGRMVESIDELPGDVFLLDVMPPAALEIAADRLTPSSRRRLERWEPGPGVFKVDWALDGPIPWADSLSGQAGTVHVGGSYEEVEAAEQAVFDGEHPERPFVLLAQQSLFDPTRAPEGKHTAWGYSHVPNGSTVDMTTAIEAQVERFAPGFKDLILHRSTRDPAGFEAHNPNLIGGDIGGGGFGLGKVLQMGNRRPYTLGGGVYLCSAAAPPGAGVHGMCGYHAARAALED
jgi:phytoene dehydrogenase-like protein